MSTELYNIPGDSYLKCCGILITFLLVTVQCSWTPEVQTPIHRSEKGYVVLQTFSKFNIQPQHPHDLSPRLIKQILQGIAQSQERGILQELFISDHQSSPVFSPGQIEFLTPFIVEALSTATSEELIVFQSPGNEKGDVQVNGTVALFPPAVFFLTLQNSENYPRSPSKVSSTRNLYKPPTLLFSKEKALLQPEEAKQFMKTASKDSWIAINYAPLSPFSEGRQKDESLPPQSNMNLELEESQQEQNTLQEELQEMRKAIDEQAKEIQRLQKTNP